MDNAISIQNVHTRAIAGHTQATPMQFEYHAICCLPSMCMLSHMHEMNGECATQLVG